jgi:hypothetical protein
VRLFLRKSRAGIGCFIYTRSKNAAKSFVSRRCSKFVLVPPGSKMIMLPPDRLADLPPQEARTNSRAAGFSICGAFHAKIEFAAGEGCALSALSALSLHTGCAKPSCPYYTKSENALARRERPGDEINEINEISYLSHATLGWLYSKGERGALPSVPGDW